MRQRGFNLIETLTASVILSGAVLAIGSICTKALVGTRLNAHYEAAASIIDRQLTLIDYTGIDAFIENGQMEGIVETPEPGYQWQVTTEYEGTDSIYLVTITVNWLEGTRPYHLTTQTMLNGTSRMTLTTTEDSRS